LGYGADGEALIKHARGARGKINTRTGLNVARGALRDGQRVFVDKDVFVFEG
jgi:hypothetical protein